MFDCPTKSYWGNRHRLACVFVVLSPVALTGMTCNGLCPAPDQDLNYSVAGVVNQRVFVQRSGSFAGSGINPPIVNSLAEYDISTSHGSLAFCDHGGLIRGHELAWIDLSGVFIQNLETGEVTFHDPTSVSQEQSGADHDTTRRLLDFSDTYVFVEQRFGCCGGNEDFSIYAVDRSTNTSKGITGWGDGSGNRFRPGFVANRQSAVVIGNVRFHFTKFVMNVFDVTTGTSRELLGPGPEQPYLADLTDQRFTWAREGPGAVSRVTIVNVFAADLETLDITELVSFENITEGPFESRHEDRPYQLSGNYMLVSHSIGLVPVYDLWSLANPPAKIRTISTDAKPVFAGNWIVLQSTPDGPFTLIDPVTDEHATIPNPFAN